MPLYRSHQIIIEVNVFLYVVDVELSLVQASICFEKYLWLIFAQL
jgi:hypothetical protein